jgi:hypothetical protein
MTGPNSAAVNPDSSAPNSFDVPMKILFTDETRPRISSGVISCTIEPRMITLTLSNAPMRKSTPSDNQNTFDKPNRIVRRRTRSRTTATLCQLFHWRQMRNEHRHHKSADCRHRTHPAETHRPQ